MKKKTLFTMIAAVTFAGMLTGCGGIEETAEGVAGKSSARTEEEAAEGETREKEDDSPLGNKVTESVDSGADSPAVYMTSDISSDGLIAVYEALQISPEGRVAVKLSTGEPGSNYLRTDLIGDLVRSFGNPTIVECNTAYGGSRANTAMHYQVAEDHGYTEIADVDIMDEDGSMTLPVTGGANLEENYVGSHFENYDYFVVLSHFKGHAMAEPDMHDIGILASYDPVALDQACIDLVYSAEDGDSLIERIESRNGLHTLEHAEEIGLGSRTYELVNIDD